MEGPVMKYAILNQRTDVRMHIRPDVSKEKFDDQGPLSVTAGTPVKIIQYNKVGPTSSLRSNKLSIIEVLDFVEKDPIYENQYECPQANLFMVTDALWPYVISITRPRRLMFLQDEQHSRWILDRQKKDIVSVSGEPFGKKDLRYTCIIRDICPVQQIYPAGYIFCLELLDFTAGTSPQADIIPFSKIYMHCDPKLAIFTTADWISSIPIEEKKKFSPRNFFNETLDKFCTAVGPTSCAAGSPTTSSLRRTKSIKRKEATAQFYDTSSVLDTNEGNIISLETGPAVVLFDEMERRSSKTTEGALKQILTHDNDDFKQSIENYERRGLERQHTASQMPPGILKYRRTPSNNGAANAISTTTKENTVTKPPSILNLGDRDIIVIDKADICESMKNESDVIVLDAVDKGDNKHVDLVTLLGSDWPNSAGDVASILSKSVKPIVLQKPEQQTTANTVSSNSTQARMTERNKSPNVMAHIHSQNRLTERNGPISELCNANTNYPKTSNKSTQHVAKSSERPLTVDAAGNAPAPVFGPSVEAVCLQPSPMQELPNTGLGVGSMVELTLPELGDDLYGVIRWIGKPRQAKGIMVGVELEDEQSDKQLPTTNGSYEGEALFKCQEGRALFVTPDCCTKDRRFVDVDASILAPKTNGSAQMDLKMFGQVDCPSVAGAVAPRKFPDSDALKEICGKFKGIQGHHNSCYLDATLFSMFTFTSVFDSLLFRPPEDGDISSYSEVQKVLREEIVNPLRKNVFVRADRVMKLRRLLDRLSSVRGLTSEEKDPEEFLNSLLAQIMRVEPFLKLSSGQDAYFYQLFVEKDEQLVFPSVQKLFEQSFHTSDIKLKEVPSCLIIQMPRFGKNYKMYPRILPSQVLDVTDIIENSPRQCSVCGGLAEYECRECFDQGQGSIAMGLESTAFCPTCLETAHKHSKRARHTSRKLNVPQDFRLMAQSTLVPRLFMELFAVVCIETSHYVAFVKAGSGPDAPWCFFDSMADRNGEQNGYNIPEMLSVPELPQWLSEEGARTVNETSSNDKMLPEHAKRIFCDAYMCMYQSTDVMMYR